ncbi:Fe-S cluster assembly ATPase SufC [Candidatus Beckwithbacteria bacterium RBG_13_42_9]|uniref:Fe-S cluster assembly ATPase SufC n=1 Tax=Candidatus Beckwithbacteria bacterium RBG_13_42_9 TaxID=1797457 RepID=A0A1F5E3Y3_9BACT|nr:MAG: Fe-S cluster assembly ATPase SufC [Candidatus Beckwithbacteria bacterium RBG_13_42_9]
MLVIKNLQVTVNSKEIIKGISLEIKPGEIQALMGPNGSGKSTLALALAGSQKYKVSAKGRSSSGRKSEISIDGKDLLSLSPDKRARLGLFVSFQEPVAIPGVKVFSFLKEAYEKLTGKHLLTSQFKELILGQAETLKLAPDFWQKELNQQFSGGERKRLEMLQALLFIPKYAIFDEIDSGIDLDGLKLIKKAILKLQKMGTGIILITHHPRLLKLIKPDKIHVLVDGRLVKSGNGEILKRLEKSGYKSFYCVMCSCPGEICPQHGQTKL